jgi:acetyl esterase/lipase
MFHNYELDLIRDEGVVFAQRLRAAGVAATSKIINGAHHVPELAMPDAVPEITRDTLASIAAFAKGLAAN